ncbi:DUF6734 family protein [Streptomyces albireticuli]|uniref:DUF6734 domain-containing protein n=1 Tax=Streptomyces albireticuli TaxID=1940 RepID=A0A2A2CZB4_9ACTN|nr:DUF6734 family protein [Streptomyces albireticuli]MCD9195281.1 hypothetical protein [Streptomyces albireticuli]PAU45533.1 hypothetical protein CK936_28880 [Streptomyces albireticuli]
MKAIHVLSTRPTTNYYVSRADGSPYRQEDFEVLTTILSALEWRRHNGVIRLYTDAAGRDFYDRLELLDLWDGGVDTELLESASRAINCGVFWSFGKIVALRQEEAPCCVMDIDLVVWAGIQQLVTAEVMSLHEESLGFAAYVGRDRLVAPPGFDWSGLDWSVTPCSAALLLFAENTFKNAYADRALSFMEGNPVRSEPEGALPTYPIFAEQRLLPMCAKAYGVRIGSFLRDFTGVELWSGRKNTTFTHLWNAKTLLHNNPDKRRELCARYAHRVGQDYPDVAEALARSRLLREHFRAADELPHV